MARKNHYEVLGIGRGESAERIRTKFRDLAKRHHPDRAGSDATSTFRDIIEAYEALSNPVTRSRYDDALRRTESSGAPAAAPPARSPSNASAGSPRRTSEVRPGRSPGFVGRGEDHATLEFDLVLSPSEAARGVTVPVEVPVSARCTACGGLSWTSLRCTRCRGSGTIRKERTLRLQFAPGIRDGTVVDITFDELGIPSAPIRMRIVIDVR
jgi:DnaJ-class molecular chaperone